jgi:hypothetical protein
MSPRLFNRRRFLHRGLTAGLGGLAVAAPAPSQGKDALPPARAITRGPKHHWFGYYDKLEFDPAGRYVLGMQVDFEHRSPKPDDAVRVGMVDLRDSDRWIDLGRSTAWCWQQGCMLQWLPGSKTKVLWNDRDGKRYVCRVLDVKSRELRTIPHPVYALSPDGKSAVSTDFRRLADTRPGYGYNGIPDPNGDDLAPKDSGVFRVDLETGKQRLILSIADVVRFGRRLRGMEGAKHWFNHLLYNPDGSRFVFLHRWQSSGGRQTRMLTATPEGKDLRVIDDNGLTSHFIWRDAKRILAFSDQLPHGKRFYLFEDAGKRKVEVVGKDVMTADGHCSYLPGNEWVLNDTYPDRERLQRPYLYHVKTGRKVPLGHFRSPPAYTGEWRCDTHPRFSPDGRSVVIDSPHAGAGRQLHLIDVSKITGRG